MQLETAFATELLFTHGTSLFFSFVFDGNMRLDPLFGEQLSAVRAGSFGKRRFVGGSLAGSAAAAAASAAFMSSQIAGFDKSSPALGAFLFLLPFVDEGDVVAEILESRAEFRTHVAHEAMAISAGAPATALTPLETLLRLCFPFRPLRQSLDPLLAVNVLVVLVEVALTGAHPTAT